MELSTPETQVVPRSLRNKGQRKCISEDGVYSLGNLLKQKILNSQDIILCSLCGAKGRITVDGW